jgi:hypothetical protein
MKLTVFLIPVMLFIHSLGHPQSDTTFKPGGKIIVQVFDRTIYNATAGTYGMYINRAFLGYSYHFAPQWSGAIVLDAGNPTVFGNLEVKDTAGNNLETSYLYNEGSVYTFYLKFAFAEYNPAKSVKIQAGGILQNHYITQEKFWGYRYVLQTFQDLYFKTPSSDLGLIVYYTPAEMVSIDAAITNGYGIRFNRSSWGYPKFAGGITLKPFKGMMFRAYYDNFKGNTDPNTATQQLFSCFAGYKFREKFRIGAEYNYHKNHNQVQGQDLYGPSVYGSYILTRKLEFFARFDYLQSNETAGSDDPWNFHKDGQLYMGGISYYPVRGISLSVSYQGWNPEDHSVFTSNLACCFEFKI